MAANRAYSQDGRETCKPPEKLNKTTPLPVQGRLPGTGGWIPAGGRDADDRPARAGAADPGAPVGHPVCGDTSVITYIDRVCISQAAPVMQRELGLSDKQMALVFSAFTFAYAAFEIPAAGWATGSDRAGC